MHNELQNGIKFFSPQPPLYGLSLKKSLIKNHATLFESSQVVNRIKYN